MNAQQLPNFSDLYSAWSNQKRGAKAEMRRVTTPDELMDLPVFYRLVNSCGWESGMKPWDKERWSRLVFLMENIEPSGDNSLGEALAISSKVKEKRLFQIVRADSPNDIVQLRRVLKQAQPQVNWQKMAEQVWDWSPRSKRNLLEDFVLNVKD